MEKINTLKWKDVLAQTSKELTEVSYRTWFLPLVPLEMDEEKGIMSIAVTDKFKADMFVRNPRYIEVLEKSVKSVFKKQYKILITHKSEDEIKKILEGKRVNVAAPSIDGVTPSEPPIPRDSIDPDATARTSTKPNAHATITAATTITTTTPFESLGCGSISSSSGRKDGAVLGGTLIRSPFV